jgi:hypothetical protein
MDSIEELNEKIIRLAEKYGIKIDSKLVFGEVEEINMAKGEEILFRYEGKPAERDFCKRMLRLDKFYSREEINVMSFNGRNRKFGHNKQNYSIWNYKGGVNCQHRWVAYTVIRDKNDKIKQTAKINNAKGKAGQIASSSNNFWRYN